MTTRHELPSGGWIVLKDIDDLRGRDKRAVQHAWGKDNPDHPLSNLIDVSDHITKVVTTEVSLPYAPGANASNDWFYELKLADSNEVERLIVPISKAMFPPEPSADDVEVPNSPTVPESV